jgi:hypothetical protein
MQSFPEYFHSLNDHMFMFVNDDGTVQLIPPNQQDWSYTLQQENEDTWYVIGENDWDTKKLVARNVGNTWVIEDTTQ